MPGLLLAGRSLPPFHTIDSHPVPVCHLIRSKSRQRLGKLAATGYCASKKEYFHGVREHIVFTAEGRVAALVQVPGNRHDVNGLYALMKTAFQGKLYADCAYTPNARLGEQLKKAGILVLPARKKNARLPLAPELAEFQKKRRAPVERRIGLFDDQLNARRTLNRSEPHYRARRWTKALARNTSIHINVQNEWTTEATSHFRAAS